MVPERQNQQYSDVRLNVRHNNRHTEEINRNQDHLEGFVAIQVPEINIPWTVFVRFSSNTQIGKSSKLHATLKLALKIPSTAS
jgi:hypothetical protein